MDDKSHVTPIINNLVRSATLTIILQLYQGIQDAVSVPLETLTLPGKHSSRFIIRNEIHSALLDRQMFSREPIEFTDEGLEIMNQHYHLDGHVERSGYMGTTRHIKYLLCRFPCAHIHQG